MLRSSQLLTKLNLYYNPFARLGNKDYSFTYPTLVNLLVIILSEVFVYGVAHNPGVVGLYIIYANVALIIYFAFRDGLRGGLISVAAAMAYYFYIIYTRSYVGERLISAVETTIILGLLYSIVATVIGWLKQSVDALIEKEADGRRRLETIMQQLPVGILITDQHGRLIQRNSLIDQILGVQIPYGFVMGEDVLDNFTIDDQPINPAESPLFAALSTGQPVLAREMNMKRKGGHRLDLQVSSTPIHNDQGKIIAAASIISDVTSQKSLERQKDEFLGIASHELKTPVTSIKANVQVLQKFFEKKQDRLAVERLRKVDVQVNKLTKLINDLLDVTKIQAGYLTLNREKFKINDLICEVIEEMQVTTDHVIVTDFTANVLVLADRERIWQVLTNLISNAIKYSPHAKEVVVRTMSSHGTVTVSVQDHGIGISPQVQSKVFDRFFRATGPRQNTYPGLGLGLYVSAEIIKREQGIMWVESEEGQGSVFYFRLPIVNATDREVSV